jgi:CBS domain-containing protein
MKVGDVMSSEVRTALVNDPLSLAMRIMLGARVSGLPVVDETGGLVGILTEGDLMRRTEIETERHRARWLEFVLGPRRMAKEYVESHSRRVGDLMTNDVLTIDESALLEDAVALLERRHFKRLPVTRQGRLVGMLSRADLMRAFLRVLPKEASAGDLSDDAIEQHIEQEMRRQPWITRAAIHVTVNKGAVDLDGAVTSDTMRDALRVLVENTPGVTCVKDKLTICGPGVGYGMSPPM